MTMTHWQVFAAFVFAASPSLVVAAVVQRRDGSCAEDARSCALEALAEARLSSGGDALLQIRSSSGAGAAGGVVEERGQKQHPEAAAGAEAGEMDPHYTVHGCQCETEWAFGGETMRGCSDTKAEFASDMAWCMVTSDCDEPGGTEDGRKWDYCSLDKEVTHLRTQHGCHCNPHFFWNDTMWESCSKTSQGPKWCYVFESDQLCPESLRTEHHGAHWDYCFTTDQASPYLSSHGCHCMPEFYIGEELFKGCSEIEVNGQRMNGCIVLEDGASCHGSVQLEGSSHEVDECAIIEGDSKNETLAEFDTALSDDCHCQPKWWHEGEEYSGCVSTSDKDRKWCYLLEDARLCEEGDGTVEEDGSMQRWKYCFEDEEEPDEKAEGKKGKDGYKIVPVIVPVADSDYKSRVVADAARNRGELGQDGVAAPERAAATSPRISGVVRLLAVSSALLMAHATAN